VENTTKKAVIFLTIPLLASCTTLKPAAPEALVTPIVQMSTYQLQNEYIEIEHKINTLERKINERNSSHGSSVNLDFSGNPAILLR
jgi:hypothetical protein